MTTPRAGYGTDTWCLGSIQPGRLVHGRMVVVQAIYRRLNTPRGTLRGLDDPNGTDENEGENEANYGFDVANFVGQIGYPAVLVAIPGRVRAEIQKDERVINATVRATDTRDADGSIDIVLDVTCQLTDQLDPLSLTLGVSDAGVALLGSSA